MGRESPTRSWTREYPKTEPAPGDPRRHRVDPTHERYDSSVHAGGLSCLEMFFNISVRIVHHSQGKLRTVTFELFVNSLFG